MKKDKRIAIFLIILINLSCILNINLNNSLSSQKESILDVDDKENEYFDNIDDEILDNNSINIDLLKSSDLNFSSAYNVSQFDVLEEARSVDSVYEYYIDDPANSYQVGVPSGWNALECSINVSTYEKKQHLENNDFDPDTNWNYYTFKQDYGVEIKSEEDDKAGYVKFKDDDDDDKFNSGDYGIFTQTITDANPDGLDIHIGDLVQEVNNNTPINDDFLSNPLYTQDYDNPYGGQTYSGDDIQLSYQYDYLVAYIDPADSYFRKNPSIAWWTTFNIPFKVDYAQITISWLMNNYGFEYDDRYRVCARINNQYIDGREVIDGEYWSNNATETTIAYYGYYGFSGSHGLVTRTYDITDLIKGLSGEMKVDFGIWAYDPNSGNDRIEVKFDSLQIFANCSEKHKTGSLEFDFKWDEKENWHTFAGGSSTPAYFNIYAVINDQWIKIIPFDEIISLNQEQYYSYIFNFTEDHIHLLEENYINFKIGARFDEDTLDNWELQEEFWFDNIYFNVQYDHPNPTYSGLQMAVNDSNPIYPIHIHDQPHKVNISKWEGGKNYDLSFFSGNFSSLYMDFVINTSFCIHKDSPNASIASYEILPSQNLVLWNVTYDNSETYNSLKITNQSGLINLVNYTIKIFDFPAFDAEGINSLDWDIFNLVGPYYQNYS